MVSSVLKSYQDMRADMDEMHDDAYEKAMAMLRWEWRQQLPELLAGN